MKIRPNHKSGIGIVGIGIIGGIGALIIGIGVGLVVYKIQTFFRKPAPGGDLVTNINGIAQSPFDAGVSK